jgi:hypothetical protein
MKHSDAITFRQAGHAVMATLLDVPFLAVTSTGLQRRGIAPASTRHVADREICVAMAGPIAKAIVEFLHGRGRQSPDQTSALEIARQFEKRPKSFTAGWVNRMTETAWDYLCIPDVWIAVFKVACKIHERGTVSRAEVQAIVHPCERSLGNLTALRSSARRLKAMAA